jgi:hypothetical protein
MYLLRRLFAVDLEPQPKLDARVQGPHQFDWTKSTNALSFDSDSAPRICGIRQLTIAGIHPIGLGC